MGHPDTLFNKEEQNMEELLRRAEAGDSDSQLELACSYLLGEDCEKNEAEGLKWMLAAAEGGNATAMRN